MSGPRLFRVPIGNSHFGFAGLLRRVQAHWSMCQEVGTLCSQQKELPQSHSIRLGGPASNFNRPTKRNPTPGLCFRHHLALIDLNEF